MSRCCSTTWLCLPSAITAVGLVALFTLFARCDGPAPAHSSGTIRELEDRRVVGSTELIDALAGEDSAVRERAALAMARIQDVSYAEALARAAREADPRTRRMALFGLGQLGLAAGGRIPEAARSACRLALDDASPSIVADGVECLGKLAAAPDLPAVVDRAGHSEPLVRSAVALALMRFRYAPTWRREVSDPPPLPPEGSGVLGALLGDTDAGVRWSAAYALSRYGDAAAVEPLVRALTDPTRDTRLFAARALGRSADRSVVSALTSLQADADAGVRGEAVSALTALDAAAAVDRSLASDSSFHVRVAVVRALGAAGGPADREALLRLADDESPSVRSTAIEELGGFEAVADEWFDTKLRGDWIERTAVMRAATRDRARETRRRWIEAGLGDADIRVRCAALSAIGVEEQEVYAKQALAAALADADLAVRGTAVEQVAARADDEKRSWLEQAYGASVGDEWIEVRESIVDALAMLPGAEPWLGDVATDDQAFAVRARAAAALVRAGRARPEVVADDRPASPWLDAALPAAPRVVLETEHGEIGLRLLAAEAPVHVARFLERVRSGGYDGLVWHRVVTNFVIQGGDPRGDGWGTGGETLRDEVHRRPYLRGAVGMPKAGKDTGGCQLFITHTPTSHLDGNYTLFGLVEYGMDVVDRIEVGDRILQARESR